MTSKIEFKLLVILLSFVLTTTATSQNKANSKFRSLSPHCESICVDLPPDELKKAKTNSMSNRVVKVSATLINNTNRSIKVRASGVDWLFYEALSSIDTVKKRYECHVCYFRTVKPRTIVRFEVYADDLVDVFAIRVRFYYLGEKEEDDKLMHYVSWIDKK